MRYLLLPVFALSLLAGCTIQERMPVREVAYDFSDYNYYDRPYAESPEYRTSHSGPVADAPPPAETLQAQPTAQAASSQTVIVVVSK